MIVAAVAARASAGTFTMVMDYVARGFDALGAAILVGGLIWSIVLAVMAVRRSGWSAKAYLVLRQAFGGTLLLGLEVLVAADLVHTVAVAPTLDNVLVWTSGCLYPAEISLLAGPSPAPPTFQGLPRGDRAPHGMIRKMHGTIFATTVGGYHVQPGQRHKFAPSGFFGIVQSSISCHTACSSCSSQPAPGSATAQLVQVPIGWAGAVRTLARTTMPGVSCTGQRSGAVVIPQWVGGSPGPTDSEMPGASSALNHSASAFAVPCSRTGSSVSAS
jgi:uncharacterized membrane protein